MKAKLKRRVKGACKPEHIGRVACDRVLRSGLHPRLFYKRRQFMQAQWRLLKANIGYPLIDIRFLPIGCLEIDTYLNNLEGVGDIRGTKAQEPLEAIVFLCGLAIASLTSTMMQQRLLRKRYKNSRPAGREFLSP